MPTKSGRFAIVPARAIDDHRVSRAAKLVLMALGTYSDRHGWCWPKQETLAQRLATTRTKVNRYIAELVEHGYLEVQRGRYGNRYRIIYDSDVTIADTPNEPAVPQTVTSNLPDVPHRDTPDVPQRDTQNVPIEQEESGAAAALPDDFPNSRSLAWATEAYPTTDVPAAAKRFRLYHLAKNSYRKTWMDAWMRWMKTAWRDDHEHTAQSNSPLDTRKERASRHVEAALRARQRDPFKP